MKTAIVSEYTRRVAHELDDRHNAWVMYNRVEKIEQVSELGESLFLELPNHESWLTDYENIGAHVAQAAERRAKIQGYLAQFKKFNQRRQYAIQYKVPMWQIDAHVARAKSELAYVTILQTKLREVRRVSSNYLYEQKMSEWGGQDTLLYQLWMAAKESLKQDSIDPLRRALDGGGLGDLIGKTLAVNNSTAILNTPSERAKLDAHVAERLTEQSNCVDGDVGQLR